MYFKYDKKNKYKDSIIHIEMPAFALYDDIEFEFNVVPNPSHDKSKIFKISKKKLKLISRKSNV